MILQFCFDCYAPQRDADAAALLKVMTLGDALGNGFVERYPRALLICGSSDPLVLANRKIAELLQQIDAECRLLEVPGLHAFHGIPPQWLGDVWKSNTYPTTCEMVHFLSDGRVNLPEEVESGRFSWSLPIVLLAHVVVPGYLAWRIYFILLASDL